MPSTGQTSSGDIGYCEFRRTTVGIIRTWNGPTVAAVDCDHLHCGCSKHCDLYQRAPVGFTKHYQDTPAE